MIVVVTGASGYIGGRLVGCLQARPNTEVRAVVHRRDDQLDCDHVVGNLAFGDLEPIIDACRGADAVVHLAGRSEVVAANEPDRALSETVVATSRLAAAAATAGVPRIVYVSTVHVYGRRLEGGAVVTEDLRPEPRAIYAIARLASEHLLARLADTAEVVVLRLTNSVGAPSHPGVDRWTLVANDLCRQAATTGRLELTTSGRQWRDFVALSDVCDLLADAGVSGSVPAGTYNLASGEPRTVLELAELVQEATEAVAGHRPELIVASSTNDQRSAPFRVSVDKLASIGWRATTPLRAAVDETLRFCLDHADGLRRVPR